MEIYFKALNISEILASWYEKIGSENCGAFITFTGIVRNENGIDGLSFDIYEPLLRSWFDKWQEKAKKMDAKLFFAHAKGDVEVYKCSYLSAVLSPKRKVALKLIDEFVEDFKANAPIWKYDIKGNERIFASDRSQKLKGAGILS